MLSNNIKSNYSEAGLILHLLKYILQQQTLLKHLYMYVKARPQSYMKNKAQGTRSCAL